jgi:CBS domain-containing protein
MTVGHILEKKNGKLFTIKRDDTVQGALEIMVREKIGSLPVVNDEGLMIGIISERDYIRKAVPERKVPWEIYVRDLMTEKVLSVTKSNSLQECMKIMATNRIRHLPVMEESKMLGMLSITDVVSALRSARFVMDQ